MKNHDSRITVNTFLPATLYVVLVLVAAWWFADLRFALNRDFPLATSQMLTDGTAYKPFQLRVMVPWLAALIRQISGGEIESIYQALEAVFTALLVFCFYYWLRASFTRRVAAILSLFVLFVLPFNLLLPRGLFAIRVPYDVSSAMFFALLSALIVRGKWKWVWLVFPLAVLNRESVIFLVAAYALAEFRQSPVKCWVPRAGLALIAWVLVRVILTLIYQDNPGAMLELTHVGTNHTHLATNLRILTSWSGLLHVASSFGFLWCVPVFFFRKIESRYLRVAFMMLPVYFLGIVFIGNVHEIRNYTEWTPVVLMSVIQVVCQLGREN
jgi:hypothetical protein